MTEYLEKHNLKTKEDIAQHIVELKRNTIPDLGLISSLAYYLFSPEKYKLTDFEKYILEELKNNEGYGMEITLPQFPKDHPISEALREREHFLHEHFILGENISSCNYLNPAEKSPITEESFKPSSILLDEITHFKFPEKQSVLNDHVKESIEKSFKEECEEIRSKRKIREELQEYKNYAINDNTLVNNLLDISEILLTETEEDFCRVITNIKESKMEEPIFKDNPNLGENTSITPDQVREGIQKGVELLNKIKDKRAVDVLEMGQIVGKKENKNKTDYSEIDWDIIDLMAKRFNDNKHKYPKDNMLKPIDKKELLFASFRHLRKMIQPIENDEETFQEHLTAVLCNMQMVYQQDKLNKS